MIERQKYLFVINPVAGGLDKSELVERLEETTLPRPASIIWTQPDTHLYLKEEITNGHYDAVIAAGGDGTVHMVAEALLGTGIPMGIMPMGSGNGLAKDLRIPLDLDDAIRTAFTGTALPLDVIHFNGQPCFHICDAGLNARVVMEYAHGKHRTIRAYAWHLLKFYFDSGPNTATLFVDEQHAYTGKAYMIALCNGKRFGSDLIINPSGIADDGVMEIVVLKEFPKTAGPGILLDLMAGELDPDYFITFTGQTCSYQLEQMWPWQIDGEYAGQGTNYAGRVQKGDLQVIQDILAD